jgi:hypothetical protein
MGLVDAIEGRSGLLGAVGQTGLHVLFPDEFELYVCAFELVDRDLKTKQYFIFPIMPSSISETIPSITNIKKTSGGVTVLTNSHFIPTDISLNGNFGGNKFKFLMGQTYQSLISTFKDNGTVTQNSVANGLINVFQEDIKTGYGCIKVMESIFEQLKTLDSGAPYRLIFYNLAFNKAYFVTPMSIAFSQNQESNMIWNYSLSLKSLAPIDNLVNRDKLKSDAQLSVDGFVQKRVDGLLSSLNSIKLPPHPTPPKPF